MVKINENFLTMKKNYLFIDIAKRLKAFTAANPNKPLIRMGIGDVTLPLAPVVVEAIKKAQEEGNDKAVKVFTKAKLAESVHAEKYLEAYNNLDAADDDNYYLCPFCGYIHKGAEAPEVCPICGAKKAAFKEF